MDEMEDETFVRAAYQEKGKGRNDRLWVAPKGENLLFSFLKKDPQYLKNGAKLSCIIACIVSKTIEKVTGLTPSIKWPNDIYIHGKKAVGILLQGKLPLGIVIGIGINVNQKEFLGEYRIPPTSLSLEVGKDIDIDALYQALTDALIEPIQFDENHHYFDDHDYLKNKMIEYLKDDEIRSGIVIGVDEEFRLLIQNKDVIEAVTSGEIRSIITKGQE